MVLQFCVCELCTRLNMLCSWHLFYTVLRSTSSIHVFWSFKAAPLTTFYQSFVIFSTCYSYFINFRIASSGDSPLKKFHTKQKNSLGNCTAHSWYIAIKLVQSFDKSLVPTRPNSCSSSKEKNAYYIQKVGWSMDIWQRSLEAFHGLNCLYSVNAAALFPYV